MAGVTANRAPEEMFSRMGYSRDRSSGASGLKAFTAFSRVEGGYRVGFGV